MISMPLENLGQPIHLNVQLVKTAFHSATARTTQNYLGEPKRHVNLSEIPMVNGLNLFET